MCEWGNTELVTVKIPADLSCIGEPGWKPKLIDSCIAPLVDALQRGGIDMRSSCCGHGKNVGHIILQDGRTLLIVDTEEWYSRRARYLLKLLCEWAKWLIYCQNYRGRLRYWIWRRAW